MKVEPIYRLTIPGQKEPVELNKDQAEELFHQLQLALGKQTPVPYVPIYPNPFDGPTVPLTPVSPLPWTDPVYPQVWCKTGISVTTAPGNSSTDCKLQTQTGDH